jgi:hypothetical protein
MPVTKQEGRQTSIGNKALELAVDRSECSDNIGSFGFRVRGGSVHAARTIMLADLQRLLSCFGDTNTDHENYLKAIEDENCLHKRSGRTRTLSARHLSELYALDRSVTVFKGLRYFWNRDPQGQPLLALLCAYARDPLLRFSAAYILKTPEGTELARADLASVLEERFPGRFSSNTASSIIRNLSSTWTQTGHLVGRVKKVRQRATATVGSLSYALLLGYLSGLRGVELLSSEYVRIIDCNVDRAIDLGTQASQRGWLDFKRISNVIDVSFPNLLSEDEVRTSREQS